VDWLVPIVVALIGGPMMWGLHRFDKRNSSQHEQNLGMLSRIEFKIEKLDDRIHDHISWHGHQELVNSRKKVKV
jgi:hypothetical protein